MIDPLEALSYGFLQRALVAGLVVAVVCSLLGVFLVLRGMSLIGDGLGHIAFGGLAIGLATGVYPLAAALVAAVFAAVAIQLLQDRGILRGDTAIGILFTAGLSTGILVVGLTGGFSVDVESYLFGSIVTVSAGDVVLVSVIGAALALALLLLYKEFAYLAFSEEDARVSGVPVRALNLVFAAVTAAAIVVSAKIVGVLLVSALVVVPAAASLQIARSFRSALLFAVAFALVAVLVGLYASLALDVAAGAGIAIAAIGVFVLVAAGKAARSRAA